MATFFHGTTVENAIDMVKYDFLSSTIKDCTWTCSDDTGVYLWSLDKFIEIGEMEDDESTDRIICQAFESAQVTAATSGTLKTGLVVFEFEIDSHLVEDDWSCENMADQASVIDNDDLSIDNIKTIHYNGEAYAPSLRLIHLLYVAQHDYINLDSLSTVEQTALEALQGSDLYLEPEHKWESISTEEFLQKA